MSDFIVTTFTGAIEKGGTNANVYVVLHGKEGNASEKIYLDNPNRNDFEKGQCDTFNVSTDKVDDVKFITIGHDNSGEKPGWFLDRVTIQNKQTGKTLDFMVNRWFSKSDDDGKIERDLYPHNYRITTCTGNVEKAGTDSNVYIILHGEKNQSSNKIFLDNSDHDDFEKNQYSDFNVSTSDIGDVESITIGHDNSGKKPGWFLERVIVKNITTGKEKDFIAKRWLSKTDDDGKIEITLYDSTYEIAIYTGSKKRGGTDANVYVEIRGSKGNLLKTYLDTVDKDDFEKNQVDKFTVSVPDLGDLKVLTIGHDNNGKRAGWYLEKVIVTRKNDGANWTFKAGAWLEDNHCSTNLIPNK